jgi:hypothetical protein
MRFDIRTQKMDLPTAVGGYIERRLRFSLGRVDSRVDRVTVRIFDISGSRCGVGKCCRITAHLLSSETVGVQGFDRDLFAAIVALHREECVMSDIALCFSCSQNTLTIESKGGLPYENKFKARPIDNPRPGLA